MKLMILLLTVLLNSSIYARQYIQCAIDDSWDRVVINLDGEKSTLFMTTGVHLPGGDFVLKDLKFDHSDESFYYYVTQGDVYEEILISNEFINKSLSNFNVKMNMIDTTKDYSYEVSLGCFSSIYN